MRNLALMMLVVLFAASCTLDDPLEPIDINEIISVSLVPDSITGNDSLLYFVVADSSSSRLVQAIIGEKAAASQTITFSTTHGVLTKVGELPTSASSRTLSILAENREVMIQLNALNVTSEQVHVSASIGNNTNQTTLQFVAAYPDDFQILPLAAVNDTNQPVNVVVEAFRQNGVVSENIRFAVESMAPDSIKLNHPQFVSMKNQRASFEIANVTKKRGPVTINILMPTSYGDSLVKSVNYVYD